MFEPTVMFFEMTNSPATFQTMVNELFKDLINEDLVAVYMDNILIYGGENEEQQSKIIWRMLQICHENDLFLKGEKCEFYKKEMAFLGMIITPDRVKMDPKKVKSILEWPQPKNVTDVQSFLGLANYYRRFVEGFSGLAHGLHELLKKINSGSGQKTSSSHSNT